ncbi:ATP-binding protein [Candidatus Dojkabacteria bacterium]|nr:ATP-binding protein [Candidatus Dojkabacteria bacterium]
MQDLKDKIADFLENVPISTEQPVSSSSIGKDLKGETLHSVIVFLQLFNCVEIKSKGKKAGEWKVKSVSPTADYFLRSLARYIRKENSLISSWAKLGTTDEKGSIFDWGTKYLAEMEKRRTVKFSDKYPTRLVSVSQAIIKARVKGYEEPLFLVQLDEKIDQYQFIGGRKIGSDKDLKATIERELSEELYKNDMVKKHNYTLEPLAENMRHYEISPTFGAFTEYTFSIYQIMFAEEDIKLGGGDIWVSAKELEAEQSYDGKHIRLTFEPEKVIGKTYDELPLSTVRVQPEFARKKAASKDSTASAQKIQDLISEGESTNLEFKATIRWDKRRNQVNKDLEKVVVKEISAFLNSKGGTLLIGVDDDGTVIGLGDDIKTLRKQNLDGYMQAVVSLISDNIGVQYCSNVDVSFEKINGDDICVLSIRKASGPVFVKNNDKKEFYVRRSNTSRLLDSEETYNYILHTWG